MSQSPELPEAVPGLTVARSVWISGPVAASGVRLSPWAVTSCRLVLPVRRPGPPGGLDVSQGPEPPEAVPGAHRGRSA